MRFTNGEEMGWADYTDPMPQTILVRVLDGRHKHLDAYIYTLRTTLRQGAPVLEVEMMLGKP